MESTGSGPPARLRLGVALTLLVAAAPAGNPANAAAFQLKETSAVAEGTALAGSGSAADSPATVFSNPAGMTQLPGVQVSLGGSLVAPSFVYHGTATDPFGRPVAGASGRDGGNLAFVPNGYITCRLTPEISLGLGLTSPFGESSYYGPGFVGRYQADKTELQTLDINPALAWQVAPWLSLGVGVSADYALAEFDTDLDSSALAFGTFGRPLPLADGLARFRGDDWTFGYNFGALLTPAPGTKIGLTYRSRLQHDLAGTASFDAPLPLSLSPALRTSAASLKLVLPPTVGFSVTQTLAPRWTGYGELDWTNWSQLRSLNLIRSDGTVIDRDKEGYRNGFFVAFGASYQVTSRLAIRAGTAFDKSPINAAYLDPRVPDANHYWLAAGASYRIMPGTLVDFGYAHIFVDDSLIHEYSMTGDLLSGRFSNSVDVLSLGTRTRF